MVIESENLHTVKWLSNQCNMPIRTLYEHIKKGILPAINIDGTILILSTELPAYIKNKIAKHEKYKIQNMVS